MEDRVWAWCWPTEDLVHAEEGFGFRGPASTPGEGVDAGMVGDEA